MKKDVTIIGAGLVGSLLSIYLVKRGYSVSIFERRRDMRREQEQASRSINLALSDRGIKALKEVDIAEEILELAIPMTGRFIHNTGGGTAFQPYGKQGQFINSISRRELNCRLMDLAEKKGVRISFNKKCESIHWQKTEIIFEDTETREVDKKMGTDLIFGADGAFSAARLAHMMQHPNFDYQQYYIDCGYKELSFPAGEHGQFLLEKNALHIWPRKEYMLIALPNPDGSFTGTLFFPFEGDLSFEQLDTEKKVDEFFASVFPDVRSMVPDLVKQFFNPTSSLVR